MRRDWPFDLVSQQDRAGADLEPADGPTITPRVLGVGLRGECRLKPQTACLPRRPCADRGTQPERRRGRLHGLVGHGQQLRAERVQVDLLAQAAVNAATVRAAS
jgi:hypothetical protein